MKPFTLTIIAFFLLFGQYCVGQTNNYQSFPESAYWRVDAEAWDNFTGCQEYYYYHYCFNGDTIINANSYKKIFRFPVEIITQGGGEHCYVWPWAIFTGYRGALRDDPVTNKVYFVTPNQDNESLLFDYNLLVGDTIEGELTSNCTMSISSIDSILVGLEYRKRWNFTTCNEGEGYFIQGIGSDNGLIEWFNSFGFSSTHLVCVKDSEQVLFNSGWNSVFGCELITSTENESKFELSASFYPNPFYEKTTLSSDNYLQNATFTIMNSMGKTVKQVLNITGKGVTIYRENLTSGLYFYTLIEANKTIAAGKLIITEN